MGGGGEDFFRIGGNVGTGVFATSAAGGATILTWGGWTVFEAASPIFISGNFISPISKSLNEPVAPKAAKSILGIVGCADDCSVS